MFKRFLLLSPLKYLFVPLAKLSSLAAMERNAKASVLRRIDRRGKTEHPDLFDFVLPIDAPLPGSKAELYHLVSTSMQLVGAGFGPMADWYYGTLFYLLEEPKCLELVVNEIRGVFANYEDITPATTAQLPYLHGCMEETLRLLSNNDTGLPRYSPGAVVDGHYVPKGV
jgi:cytochrome P450